MSNGHHDYSILDLIGDFKFLLNLLSLTRNCNQYDGLVPKIFEEFRNILLYPQYQLSPDLYSTRWQFSAI